MDQLHPQNLALVCVGVNRISTPDWGSAAKLPQQRLRDPFGKNDVTDWWHSGCAAKAFPDPTAPAQPEASDLEKAIDFLWPHYTDEKMPKLEFAAKSQECKRLAAAFTTIRAEAEAKGRRAMKEQCAQVAEAAQLPQHYRWGRDAMEQFEFGKKRAAAAIRALEDDRG